MKAITYSQIISARTYTEIMSQHIYMQEADNIVAGTALKHATSVSKVPTILEIGCGPGRITKLLIGQGANVHGADIDQAFLQEAQNAVPQATFVQADLITYQHPTLVDVVVSHGLHHHIHPNHLQTVARYIKPGGVYVLGDEFLPHYDTNSERQLRAIAWYAHVIAEALSSNHSVLATEETKTLLDDLFYGLSLQKTEARIELVLHNAPKINELFRQQHWTKFDHTINEVFEEVIASPETEASSKLKLSRGDYKICHAEFIKQLEGTGFEIEDLQTVGPTNTIGGFKIYVLKKI